MKKELFLEIIIFMVIKRIMEKTKIDVHEYTTKNEEFFPFAFLFLGLLLLEALIRYLLVRHNP